MGKIRVLVLFGKYGLEIFKASTDDETYESALKVMEGILDHTDYYHDCNAKVIDILDREDGKSALRFLLSRQGYEYERVELINVK